MKKISYILVSLVLTSLFMACERQDPFVDRTVAPLLVQILGDSGIPSSGLSTDPTVSSTYGSSAKMGIKVLELDKTNILDYTKGIDSLPASAVDLTIKFRGGGEIGRFITDGDGLASIEVPWSTLGVTGAGTTISLSASGSYKDVTFTKLFKLSSK
jgi:hypothetical protein